VGLEEGWSAELMNPLSEEARLKLRMKLLVRRPVKEDMLRWRRSVRGMGELNVFTIEGEAGWRAEPLGLREPELRIRPEVRELKVEFPEKFRDLSQLEFPEELRGLSTGDKSEIPENFDEQSDIPENSQLEFPETS